MPRRDHQIVSGANRLANKLFVGLACQDCSRDIESALAQRRRDALQRFLGFPLQGIRQGRISVRGLPEVNRQRRENLGEGELRFALPRPPCGTIYNFLRFSTLRQIGQDALESHNV